MLVALARPRIATKHSTASSSARLPSSGNDSVCALARALNTTSYTSGYRCSPGW